MERPGEGLDESEKDVPPGDKTAVILVPGEYTDPDEVLPGVITA